MIRLLVALLCPLLLSADAESGRALKEAGLRAGLWHAVLDENQAQMFAPAEIRHILLNISLGVFDEERPVRTEIRAANFFLQTADFNSSGAIWLVDYPVLDGDRLRLDARWYNSYRGDQPRVNVEAAYSPTAESLVGTISWQGKSTPIKFTRLAPGTSAFEGEWVTDETRSPGVFHIRAMGRGQYVAILDQPSAPAQALFGAVFVGSIESGRLKLRLQSEHEWHWFEAVLDEQRKLMIGEWSGSGFLTDTGEFHRAETQWYVPRVP